MNREEPSAEPSGMLSAGNVAYRWGSPGPDTFLIPLDWGCRRRCKPCADVAELGILYLRVVLVEIPVQIGGIPLLRLNMTTRPIANKYREGKLQRTLKREFKRA